jgi:hypothetical protein
MKTIALIATCFLAGSLHAEPLIQILWPATPPGAAA